MLTHPRGQGSFLQILKVSCLFTFLNVSAVCLHFVYPIKGDGLDLDYIVQGFDIDPMEARLILGGKNEPSDFSDILDGIGGPSIGAEGQLFVYIFKSSAVCLQFLFTALRALAEGFESRRGNVITTIGEGEDVDKLLQDEMLDSCDNPAIRKIVRRSAVCLHF